MTDRFFSSEEKAKLTQLINEGLTVMQEVDDLNGGLKDTVKEIAEELSESPNGVRMILTKAGVYVKKAQATGNGGASSGGSRVSKQAAQDALTAAIIDKGLTVDEDIISKLTGKAAQYFAGLLAD